MRNIKVVIETRNASLIKKTYDFLPESFSPLVIAKVYITKPYGLTISGLVIVGYQNLHVVNSVNAWSLDVSQVVASPQFFVVSGSLVSQEHMYYSQLLSISSMLMEMYLPVQPIPSANSSKMKVLPQMSRNQVAMGHME